MKCDVIFLIHEPFLIPFRHDCGLLYIPEYASQLDSALVIESTLSSKRVHYIKAKVVLGVQRAGFKSQFCS